MLGYYACSLAVFFGPQDEDYGYVTLEAMLARKPVITCTDSGGPLEFIIEDQTGLVTAPDAEALAAAIDKLYENEPLAIELGAAGISALPFHEHFLGTDRVRTATIMKTLHQFLAYENRNRRAESRTILYRWS